MKREVSLNEISDGRLYGLNDMVRADCQDCTGCFDCCCGMGDTVILDPLDVHQLSVHLKKEPERLLEEELELGIADGNVLPHLRMTGKNEACLFLNEKGRCSIHPFRPGICRLFPLGRYYENGGFSYFLQIHECSRKNRGKIKVHKWIGMPEAKKYEQYICDWHYFLLDVQEVLYNTESADRIRDVNLYVLRQFYVQPYDAGQDFYQQFYERLQEAGKILLAQ